MNELMVILMAMCGSATEGCTVEYDTDGDLHVFTSHDIIERSYTANGVEVYLWNYEKAIAEQTTQDVSI